VLGYLTAEVFGSLPRLVGDTDELYQAYVRTIMLGMGYRPILVDAIAVEAVSSGCTVGAARRRSTIFLRS
jgi:hypothetical protein